MTRPCILVLDREHSAAISTRKLVIESAKFNVITAYSGREALETFERFPAVDALIVNATIPDISCRDIVSTIHSKMPSLPVILVQSPGGAECPGADQVLDSFDPLTIVEILHKLFPQAIAEIRRQDNALDAKENRV